MVFRFHNFITIIGYECTGLFVIRCCGYGLLHRKITREKEEFGRMEIKTDHLSWFSFIYLFVYLFFGRILV